MKFHCERCKARYSIADEKVRGKVLRVRCKSCGVAITVREGMSADRSGPNTPAAIEHSGRQMTAPVSGVPRPAPKTLELDEATPAPAEEWYVAVDGVQEGPFELAAAKARVARKRPGEDMYAWREDFAEWLPVDKVPALSAALPKRLPPPPPPRRPAPPSEDDIDPFAALPAPAAPQAMVDLIPRGDDVDLSIGEVSRVVRMGPPPPKKEAPAEPAPPPRVDGLPGIPLAITEAPAAISMNIPIASISMELPATKSTSAPVRLPPKRRAAPWLLLAAVVLSGGAAALVLLSGRSPDGMAPAAEEPPLRGDLVTNFYAKENPLVAGDGTRPAEKGSQPASEPAIVIEPDKPSRPKNPPPPPRPVVEDDNRDLRTARISEAPSGKVDSFDDPGGGGSGSLTPDDVRDAYAANEVGLKRCYERALKQDPTANVSKMDVTITIGPSGLVKNIVVPNQGALSSCVSNAIRMWRFKRSSGDFTTEFTVVFAKR